MYLDKQHPRPVYLQLKELLQNQIEQGVYLCHQQLPSERYLCQRHNLSRMTVRRALQALIAEGFAYTQAGKGTFVGHISNTCYGFPDSHQKPGTNGSLPAATDFKQKLIAPLLSFDCVGVEHTVREALAVHSLETVAGRLFFETLQNLEQKWYRGEISLLVHNYAITTLRSQLIAMVNASIMPKTGPKVLLACAPEDQHEIGLLLLALNLRRRGFVVVYLGSNLYADEFCQVIDTVQPQLVCISAATDQSATNLAELGCRYQDKLTLAKDVDTPKDEQNSRLAFGGVIFNQRPELVLEMPGYYLGQTVDDAVLSVQKML